MALYFHSRGEGSRSRVARDSGIFSGGCHCLLLESYLRCYPDLLPSLPTAAMPPSRGVVHSLFSLSDMFRYLGPQGCTQPHTHVIPRAHTHIYGPARNGLHSRSRARTKQRPWRDSSHGLAVHIFARAFHHTASGTHKRELNALTLHDSANHYATPAITCYGV